jgi:hypothetical protein
MTDDWNGTRSDLEAKGVTLRAHHISESALKGQNQSRRRVQHRLDDRVGE